MKKKFIFWGGSLVVTVAVACFSVNSNAELSLITQNLEALAISEDVEGKVYCEGDGDLLCPFNMKYGYKKVGGSYSTDN